MSKPIVNVTRRVALMPLRIVSFLWILSVHAHVAGRIRNLYGVLYDSALAPAATPSPPRWSGFSGNAGMASSRWPLAGRWRLPDRYAMRRAPRYFGVK